MEESNTSKEHNDMLQALAELWSLTLSFLKSMSLKCAIDLRIPDTIQDHGEPITLTELHSDLSLPPSRKPQFGRLLRILANYGFLSERDAGIGKEAVYNLTAIINKQGSKFNLFPFLNLQLGSDIILNSSRSMSDWFKQEDRQTACEIAYGRDLWEMANQDTKLNTMFNDAMACQSSFCMDVIVKNCGDVFGGIESLVDVGGGTGVTAKVIAENFPHIKCTVLDLPHVVGDLSNDGSAEFVPGDMFNYIPPAKAVFLKWVLHDWSDDDCIKILKRCKEAIPSKEAGGKVILVEIVVGSTCDTISNELQLLCDMMMMTVQGGKERDECEWKKIVEDAGFSSYKIVHTLGFFSIIEIYP
ncbi:hypothetical protein LUZ60_013850 [Juncus effusus]|nr:hypothetical protein LUZ60_013850 [Juncus effusus]